MLTNDEMDFVAKLIELNQAEKTYTLAELKEKSATWEDRFLDIYLKKSMLPR